MNLSAKLLAGKAELDPAAENVLDSSTAVATADSFQHSAAAGDVLPPHTHSEAEQAETPELDVSSLTASPVASATQRAADASLPAAKRSQADLPLLGAAVTVM